MCSLVYYGYKRSDEGRCAEGRGDVGENAVGKIGGIVGILRSCSSNFGVCGDWD